MQPADKVLVEARTDSFMLDLMLPGEGSEAVDMAAVVACYRGFMGQHEANWMLIKTLNHRGDNYEGVSRGTNLPQGCRPHPVVFLGVRSPRLVGEGMLACLVWAEDEQCWIRRQLPIAGEWQGAWIARYLSEVEWNALSAA